MLENDSYICFSLCKVNDNGSQPDLFLSVLSILGYFSSKMLACFSLGELYLTRTSLLPLTY